MPPENAGERKKLLLKLFLAAAGVALAALLLLREKDLHALAVRVLGALQRLGPWAFFSAMALLPAVGVPLLTFSLTAAPAFAGRMGMAGVVAAGLAAITVNLVLAYWIARWALRPWVVRLLAFFGHRAPRVELSDMGDFIVLLRVTPGIPFPVQNYLLGLVDAPFRKYFLISCAASWAVNVGFIIFGGALQSGKGKMIFTALGLIVAAAAATHLVRRHFAGRARRAAPAA